METENLLGAIQALLKLRFRTYLLSRAHNGVPTMSSGPPWKKNQNCYADIKPRVFAAIAHVNWEFEGLVSPLEKLAEVVHFDWSGQFDQYSADWHTHGKPEFNKRLLQVFESAHREKSFDIFFSYLSGRWVYPETIQRIKALGVVTVNISFDDHKSFWGKFEAGHWSGNAEIAPFYDLSLTCQNRRDLKKYIDVGAMAVFLPPGASVPHQLDAETRKDIPISFVGQRYGSRPALISYLAEHGVEVLTYGKGWPAGELNHSAMSNVLSRSIVSLGFGFIGNSHRAVGLKGRDFEVPLYGGLYLTSYNPDLKEFFKIGTEIECYKSRRDLLSKAQYYLKNTNEALAIGEAGRQRVLREHLWENRFRTLFSELARMR